MSPVVVLPCLLSSVVAARGLRPCAPSCCTIVHVPPGHDMLLDNDEPPDNDVQRRRAPGAAVGPPSPRLPPPLSGHVHCHCAAVSAVKRGGSAGAAALPVAARSSTCRPATTCRPTVTSCRATTCRPATAFRLATPSRRATTCRGCKRPATPSPRLLPPSSGHVRRRRAAMSAAKRGGGAGAAASRS